MNVDRVTNTEIIKRAKTTRKTSSVHWRPLKQNTFRRKEKEKIVDGFNSRQRKD